MVDYGTVTLIPILEKIRRHVSPTPTGHTPGFLSGAIWRPGINAQYSPQCRLPLANHSTKVSTLVCSLVISSPNFMIHTCSDSEPVPPRPEPPKSLRVTNSTASYVMLTGIKIGVSLYVSNVTHEGIVSLGFPPSKTDATVSLIVYVRYSDN